MTCYIKDGKRKGLTPYIVGARPFRSTEKMSDL